MGLDIAKEYARIFRTRDDVQKILEEANIKLVKVHEIPSDVKVLRDVRIAAIMDDFSYRSFSPECLVTQLTPESWKEQLEEMKPHFLFVESAWKGKDDLWDRKISSTSDELVSLMNYCNVKGIPTVFWNKEDPVHFNTFINTAKLFDFIFTTDIDVIKKYKSLTRNDDVFLLPFAAQPRLHNPIERYSREDAFCFAGSYYKRYEDRQKDFAIFYGTLSRMKRFDIYDRYLGSGLENYSFPDDYKGSILGSLPPGEIDKAYKGYLFGINMNSIKQSQTMFARRVFELMASNTIVLSNYSRGLRAFFGDLVISTDDGASLEDSVNRISSDPDRRDRFRLEALRSILIQHTYTDRLVYLINKVFGDNFVRKPLRPVSVVALANTSAEVERLTGFFRSQSYPRKKMLMVTDIPLDHSEEDMTVLKRTENDASKISDLVNDDYVAFFSSRDHYGPNYLLDLVNGLSYSNTEIVGKKAHYSHKENTTIIEDAGSEYLPVDRLLARSALVHLMHLKELKIGNLEDFLEKGEFVGECLAIDRFNYCRNLSSGSCSITDGNEISNTGLKMEYIQGIAEKITKGKATGIVTDIVGRELGKRLPRSRTGKLSFQPNYDGSLLLSSELGEKEHEYLYLRVKHDISELDPNDHVKFFLDADPGLNLSIVLVFLSASGERLGNLIVRSGRLGEIDIPNGTSKLHFALRPEGSGSTVIRSLTFGDIEQDKGCHLRRGSVLTLTNHYPEYNDLYRNAFVHSRLASYKKEGLGTEVVKYNPNFENKYYEFHGIDVCSLNNMTDVHTMITQGGYPTILVHFLNRQMWNVLRQYLDKTKLIVWVHGAEIQPYHRREYNYKNEEERNKAIKTSEDRMEFWRSVFSRKDPNVHFVFVSHYFAEEVMEDIGLRLEEWQYSVIHNYVDTEAFQFKQKVPEDRKKLLSIRSFASMKYANDLTVRSLIELSKRPFFNDLEIRIIGNGPLFDETVEPLRKMKNVILEKRFLPVDEYIKIFQDHGIFLTPTRWDSQGVSRDEAMSAGLVILSNRNSGVPEFVDEDSGVLVESEDFVGMADALERLYKDPEWFCKLSKGAGERVRRQNGFDNTIRKELDLIRGSPV